MLSFMSFSTLIGSGGFGCGDCIGDCTGRVIVLLGRLTKVDGITLDGGGVRIEDDWVSLLSSKLLAGKLAEVLLTTGDIWLIELLVLSKAGWHGDASVSLANGALVAMGVFTSETDDSTGAVATIEVTTLAKETAEFGAEETKTVESVGPMLLDIEDAEFSG